MTPIVKVRIIAAAAAILLTIATAYALPWLVYEYKQWVGQLTTAQQQWFNVAQAVVGALIAGYAFLRWKKRKNTK